VIGTYHSNKVEADSLTTEIAKKGRKAAMLRLDTGDVKSFDRFAGEFRKSLKETFGREDFDFLVNNAGIGIGSMIVDTREGDFDRLMNINLKGVYFLTQKLLLLMKDGGRIINLSSGLARFSLPRMSAYAMTKGAIEVFTRYLAKELGPRGITANTVAPGAIETDFGGGYVRDNPEANKSVTAITALGRAGLPDDIGPMIASLLSDDNRWVNGQRIEVSGGAHL
ncbi:MAG TPA: SDR family oxidoreductase, partial [Xanthobacteraceae bacterium]|nr:SDR family oxidoreductase [Xanthobacteraceae bacterium]